MNRIDRNLRRPRLALLALGLLLAPLATSCESTSQFPPQWAYQQVQASSERVLMEVTAMALEKCGFPVGTGVDPASLVAVSGWHTSLAPFHGKGTRARCEVRYESIAPRTWKISVRVETEKNDDIVRPLDLTYAKWVKDADDPDRARMVLQYVRALLGMDFKVGPGPSPQSR